MCPGIKSRFFPKNSRPTHAGADGSAPPHVGPLSRRRSRIRRRLTLPAAHLPERRPFPFSMLRLRLRAQHDMASCPRSCRVFPSASHTQEGSGDTRGNAHGQPHALVRIRPARFPWTELRVRLSALRKRPCKVQLGATGHPCILHQRLASRHSRQLPTRTQYVLRTCVHAPSAACAHSGSHYTRGRRPRMSHHMHTAHAPLHLGNRAVGCHDVFSAPRPTSDHT